MTYRNILVATDGTEFSSKALRAAADLAKALGSRLTAIHAVAADAAAPSDMSFIAEASLRDPPSRGSHGHGADEIAKEARAITREAGMECDVVVDSGSPWKAIVRVAEDRGCDLIVMATHGRGGASALLLGSETQKVLAHSKVPVLAVR